MPLISTQDETFEAATARPADVFEIFKLGVGPSSSHTMGPMTAAARFAGRLASSIHDGGSRLRCTLYGSLAFTGRGHATDRAVILGLAGFVPATFDFDAAEVILAEIRSRGVIAVAGGARTLGFDEQRDIVWDRLSRPEHPNAMLFELIGGDGRQFASQRFHSVGGGFIVDPDDENVTPSAQSAVPHPFVSASDLIRRCEATGLTIAQLMLQNACAHAPMGTVLAKIDEIAVAMRTCIERGLRGTGTLPGGLEVPRRARRMHERLATRAEAPADPLLPIDLVKVWALAVNEENAAGGRVVTAPTNGAAGIVPAVLRFYQDHHAGTTEGSRIYLLTAAAIAALYKRNASISGADVGCQGEVGVACSMAAGGLAAALGGDLHRIENAAEIGMEHNLGLTCDPIGGLVQIPCIERNAIGATQAINAARMALLGDGTHQISLDRVIATMKKTGEDMNEKYKETSRGGLAVSLVEC